MDKNERLPVCLLGSAFLLGFAFVIAAAFAIYPTVEQRPPLAQPQPGQVWRYCVHGENPFKEEKCYDHEVLEVKNGYVLYLYRAPETMAGAIDSEIMSVFTVGSKRIK